MPKVSTLSGISTGDTANFRILLGELDSLLTAAGFVRAADTGQIDIPTVNWPGLNLSAGYLIYRTNDSFSPVFFKIGANVGASASRLNFSIQVATATNGAGTLSGVVLPAVGSAQVNSGAAPFDSLACTGEGFAWFAFKCKAFNQSGVTPPILSLAIMRFCGADGLPNDSGFVVYGSTSGNFAYQFRLADNGVSANGYSYCLVPGDVPQGAIGGDIQFWRHFTAQPRMRINPFVFTCDQNAIPPKTQLELPMADGTTMNFICAGNGAFSFTGSGTAVDLRHTLMLPWVD